ncbi:MAG: DUF4199 domain-containing protein [Muribaculaceae bacterium]|nr:DUF4199 domain-containing protein [Muribaculaceae bacterium]
MEVTVRSIYRRGADNGLLLGLYFCIMFGFSIAGERVQAVGFVSTLMMLGVPFLVYRFLRKTYVEQHGLTQFSALWTQGIIAFAGGGLILAFVVFIYIRFIDPQIIVRQLDSLINVYTEADNQRADDMITVLTNMRDMHLYPSARDIVVQLELLSIFSGSILSMLMSLLVRMKAPLKSRNQL